MSTQIFHKFSDDHFHLSSSKRPFLGLTLQQIHHYGPLYLALLIWPFLYTDK